MGQSHIFAQYGDNPAQAPIVVDSEAVAGEVARLEARGARVVVLDDGERIRFGTLTQRLIEQHPELAL